MLAAFVELSPCDCVPTIGLDRVGALSITNLLPVPVCEATDVAFPVDVIGPVKLAFVVTPPAVRPEAVPVQFVRMPDAGVPSAGVTNAGLFSVLFVSV